MSAGDVELFSSVQRAAESSDYKGPANLSNTISQKTALFALLSEIKLILYIYVHIYIYIKCLDLFFWVITASLSDLYLFTSPPASPRRVCLRLTVRQSDSRVIKLTVGSDFFCLIGTEMKPILKRLHALSPLDKLCVKAAGLKSRRSKRFLRVSTQL